MLVTTLNIVASVTYYSKLCNNTNICYISWFLINKGQIDYLDIIEYDHLYLVRNYTNSKKNI